MASASRPPELIRAATTSQTAPYPSARFCRHSCCRAELLSARASPPAPRKVNASTYSIKLEVIVLQAMITTVKPLKTVAPLGFVGCAGAPASLAPHRPIAESAATARNRPMVAVSLSPIRTVGDLRSVVSEDLAGLCVENVSRPSLPAHKNAARPDVANRWLEILTGNTASLAAMPTAEPRKGAERRKPAFVSEEAA
jgi:hypothetical protein